MVTNQTVKAIERTLAAVLVALALRGGAAENDLLRVVASPGPDRYADGTAILPGEAYALVWMRTGYAFAGFDVNGKLVDAVNNACVAAAGLGANREGADGVEGYCPKTGFQVRAAWAAEHADGDYALVLLDTRLRGADGKLVPGGAQGRVNGWGLVKGATVQATFAAVAPGSAGTVAATKSVLPAGVAIGQPQITGIRLDGDDVEIRVKGTSDLLLYNVSAASSLPAVGGTGAATGGAAQGLADAARELTFRVPAEKGRFFKVIRD